jgi:hypothetical protein
MKALALAGAVTLALCACTAAQLSSLGTSTGNTVKAGQLFCAEATATGPLVVALANAVGAPVKVTGQAAADVAAACALINAIPVTPPPNPSQAPVVATNTTLPAA